MLRQAVFLAGGLGTRLGPLTEKLPKPMLRVGARPFLTYLIDEAARHGFSDVLILSGYLGQEIEKEFDGKTRRGAKIRVLREPEPLGTGGALRFALPYLNEIFLLANGDTFFDINLRALSLPPQAGLTMALRRTAPGQRYGSVKFEKGFVTHFYNPTDRVAGPINGGIYTMDRAVIRALPEGKSSLEIDGFPQLAGRHLIRGTVFDGYFIDIGVPEDLAKASLEIKSQIERPAVFFDRDGVLNKDKGYTHRPDQFEWNPGAKEVIRACNDAGVFVFVVTNQAGVARGLYSEATVIHLHNWMQDELAAAGAHVDAFEYCPHHPGGHVERYRRECRRRKPSPGMIEDIQKDWPIASGRSILVGDKRSDMMAAKSANVDGLMYEGGDLYAFLVPHLKKIMSQMI